MATQDRFAPYPAAGPPAFQFGRAKAYHRATGLSGLLHAAFIAILWRPRDIYRSWRWRQILRSNTGSPQTTVNGFLLDLDPEDRGLSLELGVAGLHEPLLTLILSHCIEPGAHVVDVGANIGYYALMSARYAGTEGRVTALEPAPRALRILQRNVRRNGLDNVHLHNVAAGPRPGQATMYTFPEANRNAMVNIDRTHLEEHEVRVVRLDDLLDGEDRVDLVRMDVEGYEGELLKGARATLRRFQPTVVMELHGSYMDLADIRAVLTLLLESGYENTLLFPRVRDEVFFGRAWFGRGRVVEQMTLRDLLAEDRLMRFRGHFSIAAAPAGRDVLPSFSGGPRLLDLPSWIAMLPRGDGAP